MAVGLAKDFVFLHRKFRSANFEPERARGHDPGGADAQVQQAQGGLRAERGDKEGELRAERGDGRTVRQTSTHTLSAAIGDAR